MERVMATAKNDVTGDWIKSKPSSDMFDKNFDAIFRKKKPENEPEKKECTKCECDVKGCNG